MTLYKRKDGKHWYIKLPPIKGETRYFYLSTGTTSKRDAKAVHDRYVAERWQLDKLGARPVHTWDEAVQRFLDETSHKRTHAWDCSLAEWFTHRLGGKVLSDINRDTVERLRAERAKGRKPGTVNRYMAFLRAVLRRACNDWEWLDRTPKVTAMRDSAERIRSLSIDECQRLLQELPDHLRDMALFSVATGLRQANVKRLRWSWVSLQREHLTIPASEHKNGKALGLPLPDVALQVLRRRKGIHPVYVFTYDGKPVVQVNTKAWRNALKRAGIEDFRWHDLRHTFATWHRELGTPTHELQRLGGWKSQSMVERYAHLAPEGLHKAAKRMDNLFTVAN
jgi:integrase